MANNFYKNEKFSKHKDELLVQTLQSKTNDIYIIVQDKELQKAGIDILVKKQNGSELFIDTKNITKKHNNLYFEIWSCTNVPNQSFGWAVKKTQENRKVMHVFYPECEGCTFDCYRCNKLNEVKTTAISYITDIVKFQKWYFENLDKKFHSHRESEKNRTFGVNIPIDVLIQAGCTEMYKPYLEMAQ